MELTAIPVFDNNVTAAQIGQLSHIGWSTSSRVDRPITQVGGVNDVFDNNVTAAQIKYRHANKLIHYSHVSWDLTPQPLLTGMYQPPTSAFTRSESEAFPYCRRC